MSQPPEPRPLPEGEDSFEEVHVTLADGRSIYWPKGDMTRLAPAAVCNVASRMIQLRKAIKADPFDMREVERLIASPISFEKEFLSGDSLTVHNAIKALGIEALPALSVCAEESDEKIATLEHDLFVAQSSLAEKTAEVGTWFKEAARQKSERDLLETQYRGLDQEATTLREEVSRLRNALGGASQALDMTEFADGAVHNLIRAALSPAPVDAEGEEGV